MRHEVFQMTSKLFSSSGSKLTKVYSNSSLNLAARDEPGKRCDLQRPNRWQW